MKRINRCSSVRQPELNVEFCMTRRNTSLPLRKFAYTHNVCIFIRQNAKIHLFHAHKQMYVGYHLETTASTCWTKKNLKRAMLMFYTKIP